MKTMELSGPVTLIKRSFQIFFEKRNLFYFLKIFSPSVILAVLAFPLGFILAKNGYPLSDFFSWVSTSNLSITLLVGLWFVITFFVGLWTNVSGLEAVKRVVDGNPVLEFKDTFKTSWKYLGKLILVSFVTGLIVIGGLILMIIPGIIFSVWFAFSRWAVVGEGFGTGDALRFSKSLVKGKFWKVLGRLLVLGLFGIATQIITPFTGGALILTIFGSLLLLPSYLLYKELSA